MSAAWAISEWLILENADPENILYVSVFALQMAAEHKVFDRSNAENTRWCQFFCKDVLVSSDFERLFYDPVF